MAVNAFQLIPVIKQLDVSVECFEASGNSLYLGTDDGVIIQYAVEEKKTTSDTLKYSCCFMCHKNLNTKKAIDQIRTASALRRLLALSDNNIFVLDCDVLTIISSSPRIRNVFSFCLNENPDEGDPFTLEFCVGKRRSLQLFSMNDDRISPLKEVSSNETAINMSMDGRYVCVSFSSHYYIYNMESGSCQHLFPTDSAFTFIKRISKGEFLVMAPGNLGMFVTAQGTSERPPIQWNEGVLSITYYHPYILSISPNYVCVFSLIDQQHKQTLLLNAGKLIDNFDGQLYAATNSSIQCLFPVPWTSQVIALLENGNVEESIQLMENTGAVSVSSESYLTFSNSIFQRCGFVKFSQGDFEEAKDYFLRGKLDVRELISLFPDVLCEQFQRSHPPLHQMADINQAFHFQQQLIESSKTFLCDYLLTLRSSGEKIAHRLDIDTTLIKIYSQLNVEDLLLFLESGDILCRVEECISHLQKNNQFTALIKLYRVTGETEKCILLICKLIEEETKDDAFRGVAELVDLILSTTNAALVYRFADFILERDQSEGLRLFCEMQQPLDHDKILKLLRHHPKTKKAYLHHLVDYLNVKECDYHTELVLIYADAASNCSDDPNRVELHRLLVSSKSYDPKKIQGKLEQTELYEEIAIVYGRLNNHEKALELIVDKMEDFEAAERYCVEQENYLSKEESSSVYFMLFKIFLRLALRENAACDKLNCIDDLLSRHASHLELSKVLQILPSKWGITIARRCVKASLREMLHKGKMEQVRHSLIKSELSRYKYGYHKLCTDMGPIVLNTSRICCICGKGFVSADFKIYPNGVMTHHACAIDPHICPLTGTIFV